MKKILKDPVHRITLLGVIIMVVYSIIVIYIFPKDYKPQPRKANKRDFNMYNGETVRSIAMRDDTLYILFESDEQLTITTKQIIKIYKE